MILVNLYADHLMTPERENRVRPAEEIWYATTQRPALFAHAARIVGLSPAEYREFQLALLDGKAVHVKLPHRLDAMAGYRRGRLYAVRGATIGRTREAWPSGYRVSLRDGAAVYVPDESGSLSVVRPHRDRGRHHPRNRTTTLVYVQQPDAPARAVRPPLAAAAAAVAAPKSNCAWWCFGLPIHATFPGLLGAKS